MPASHIFDINPLFHDVQMQQVFPDGKTFVDCIPLSSPEAIAKAYHEQKEKQGFDLKEFVLRHFQVPTHYAAGFEADLQQPVEQHIEALWPVLTRQPDKELGSLIPLPYPYIVPGGRFGEIYYWDSYFAMLGLKASGQEQMIANMVNNFSHLIDTVGYIPNGNRSYYIGRSQPPFYSLMVELLAAIQGENVFIKYLPQLEKEYLFWMAGVTKLQDSGDTQASVVRMPGTEILNRYWDCNDLPRPESYREDVELAELYKLEPGTTYRHLRAGAASGWDFSSRWFGKNNSFNSIHTTDIIPVDLNCLLFHLEEVLAMAQQVKGDKVASAAYRSLAAIRKTAIQDYCWNEAIHFFVDFDNITGEPSHRKTLAAGFPLFFGIATPAQAQQVAKTVQAEFLKEGGLITTLETTGQQWDAPNGWAPLHWIMIMGLDRYGHQELAKEIAGRWVDLNRKVFHRNGKLMEKYNVVDTHLEAGGGEYAGQDGFGWTNGVLLALIRKYGL